MNWDYEFMRLNRRHQRVVAVRDLAAANVKRGEYGIVTHTINFHGDGNGPIVRWRDNRMCNVYPGDVKGV